MASAGVTIGQLFVLHDDRRTLGKVIGAVMIVCAMCTAVLGAVEYYRQHHALVDTTTYAKGTVTNTVPHMVFMAAMFGLVCTGLFVVILVVA
jgi:uncharacterized membrane protein YidH (DUF202 family)